MCSVGVGGRITLGPFGAKPWDQYFQDKALDTVAKLYNRDRRHAL